MTENERNLDKAIEMLERYAKLLEKEQMKQEMISIRRLSDNK